METESEFPTLKELGRPEVILERIEEKKSGIVLIAGGHYSGKTTTIVSLAHEMKSQNRDVIHIQLPQVESLPGLDSVYAEKIHNDLLAHLAGPGRPEVLVLNDITDPMMYHLAFQVADKGSLVIIGLHAKNADEAIFNLLDGLPPAHLRHLREDYRKLVILAVHQKFRDLPNAYTLTPEFITEIKAVNASKDFFLEEDSKRYYSREAHPRFKIEYSVKTY